MEKDFFKKPKERILKFNLSDEDCDKISEKLGIYGLSVGELISNFICDLVVSIYSNGSDERDFADRWFERCWFSREQDNLLSHLLNCNDSDTIEDFLLTVDDIEYYKNNPEKHDNEIIELEEEYNNYIKDYIEDHPDANIESEILQCRIWLQEFENLKYANLKYADETSVTKLSNVSSLNNKINIAKEVCSKSHMKNDPLDREER